MKPLRICLCGALFAFAGQSAMADDTRSVVWQTSGGVTVTAPDRTSGVVWETSGGATRSGK